MKPGRELDALIAEKMMGWTEIQIVAERAFGLPPSHVNTGWPAAFVIPNYSGNMYAAWKVVERMMRDKWDISIYSNAYSQFQVEFSNDLRDSGCVLTDTVPEGICLAALSAVGVEVPA